jgi:NAD(P)H-hydrate epimerase
VVSADIPSGIRADTGEVLGDAVRADVTVTFSAGKLGLYVGQGAVHAGRVVIHDIGIPEDLLAQGCGVAVTQPPVLPRRKRDAHKGDFGRLFILAGSEGYTGAPVLASRAAVRAGAGLVTLAVPREIYPIVAVKCDEAMPWPLPDDDTAIVNKASACDLALIGPGLGQGERAQALVLRLLRELTCPVILDADGLNILSRHIDVLDARQAVTALYRAGLWGKAPLCVGAQRPPHDHGGGGRALLCQHHGQPRHGPGRVGGRSGRPDGGASGSDSG